MPCRLTSDLYSRYSIQSVQKLFNFCSESKTNQPDQPSVLHVLFPNTPNYTENINKNSFIYRFSSWYLCHKVNSTTVLTNQQKRGSCMISKVKIFHILSRNTHYYRGTLVSGQPWSSNWPLARQHNALIMGNVQRQRVLITAGHQKHFPSQLTRAGRHGPKS